MFIISVLVEVNFNHLVFFQRSTEVKACRFDSSDAPLCVTERTISSQLAVALSYRLYSVLQFMWVCGWEGGGRGSTGKLI